MFATENIILALTDFLSTELSVLNIEQNVCETVSVWEVLSRLRAKSVQFNPIPKIEKSYFLSKCILISAALWTNKKISSSDNQ